MCLIVDANIIHKVLKDGDPDFEPVRKRLFNLTGKGAIARMVYGGKLTQEYRRAGFLDTVILLDQAGHARPVNAEQIEAQIKLIRHLCKADDEHIIALARAGNVRLLCSEDKGCAEDFINRQLIDKPQGKVYRYKRHRHLLAHFCKDIP